MTQDFIEITVRRNGVPDLKFIGKCLGRTDFVMSDPKSGDPASTGRTCEFFLYQAKGGKYIAQKIWETTRLNDDGEQYSEYDNSTTQVCDDKEKVIEFFGLSWAAKELYERAGILAPSEEID